MRAIDFSHKITPRYVILQQKKLGKKFFSNRLWIFPPPLTWFFCLFSLKMTSLGIHGQAGGYWAPKYELVPKVTVDQKKRRQAKKSKYEFVLDLWIRIRIFTTNSVWAASQIRIGPLIFPPIRRIRGGGTVPPLAHVCSRGKNKVKNRLRTSPCVKMLPSKPEKGIFVIRVI